MDNRYKDFEDDGRVVADMSEIEPQPLLIPRLGRSKGSEETRARKQPSVQFDREEKRAFIGGALAAGLLVAGVIALGFAAIIFLIGRMG